MAVGTLPTSPEAYDPSGPAPTFDPLSGGAFPFEEHVPQFGLHGYGENGGAPTDVAAASTATAETIESANVAASAVAATLMLAGVGTVMVRIVIFGDLRNAPRRKGSAASAAR